MVLNWVIISVGLISHDFVNALETLPETEHEVVAVATRDQKRAQEFADRFDILTAYGDYLQLAKDPNVEIVYIGTNNLQHFSVARMMLKHDKHLFLMERIWSRCFPSYEYVLNLIRTGKIGKIRSVEVDLGVRIPE